MMSNIKRGEVCASDGTIEMSAQTFMDIELRSSQLEQLVKEGIKGMERFAYAKDVRVWIERAKALLEQEV